MRHVPDPTEHVEQDIPNLYSLVRQFLSLLCLVETYCKTNKQVKCKFEGIEQWEKELTGETKYRSSSISMSEFGSHLSSPSSWSSSACIYQQVCHYKTNNKVTDMSLHSKIQKASQLKIVWTSTSKQHEWIMWNN